MFSNSVCSYPGRGSYGDNRYRGNCTGYIVKDFFETYMKDRQGLAADPSVGSGTSEDVAKEIGIRFKGTDLHRGFNLLCDDFKTFLGEEANAVWWHPPYWDMITYSGDQWGNPHPWDMSRMSLNNFVEALNLALMNIHDSVENGGHYGVLMGNLRRNGKYYNLSSLVERVSPGTLVDEIIKIQHNCTSDRKQYAGTVVRIAHEKLLVFRKGNRESIHFLALAQLRGEQMVSSTWKTVIRRILQSGKTMNLSEIYDRVGPYAMTRNNHHWKAKTRQVLQDASLFVRVEPGVFRIAT